MTPGGITTSDSGICHLVKECGRERGGEGDEGREREERETGRDRERKIETERKREIWSTM